MSKISFFPVVYDIEKIVVKTPEGNYTVFVADLEERLGYYKYLFLKSYIDGKLRKDLCRLSVQYINGNMELHIKFVSSIYPSEDEFIIMTKTIDQVEEIRDNIRKELIQENDRLIKTLYDEKDKMIKALYEKIAELETRISNSKSKAEENSIVYLLKDGTEYVSIVSDEETFINRFYNKRIVSIVKINGCFNLPELNLGDSSITRISGLELLPNLKSLKLDCTEITKIEGLEGLPNLKILILSDNAIAKIENLDNLSKLESLNMYSCVISVIENLENLTELKYLDLSRNYITTITGLEKCINLNKLYLARNKITIIENVNYLTNLIELDLSWNNIYVIENLVELDNLVKLHLNNNNITVLPDFYYLESLKIVDISQNRIPVPTKPKYDIIY